MHYIHIGTVFPQFLQPAADTDWGPPAQRPTFCQEQEQDLANVAGTLFHPTFVILLIPVHFRKRLKNVLFWSCFKLILLALLDVSYSGAIQILRWLIDWLNKMSVFFLSHHLLRCYIICLFRIHFVIFFYSPIFLVVHLYLYFHFSA